MVKLKIEEIADSLLLKQATTKEKTQAMFQYVQAKTDIFHTSGPTDSYKYILMEVVQSRLRQQADYQNLTK